MRTILWLPISSAVILILSGCATPGGSPGTSPSGTGPFDSQGNYHEEWANDPSKWRKPGSHSQPATASDDLPEVAKNEQPPPDASPLAAAQEHAQPAFTKTSSAHPPSTAAAKSLAAKTQAQAKHKPSPEPPTTHKIPAHGDKTPAHGDKTPAHGDKTPAHGDKTPAHGEPAHKTTTHADKPPAHKTTVHDDAEAPKPKTGTKASPKAAAKPTVKGSRYTIKKGDSVDSIAAHSNASAAEIRKANHLTGSHVQPGKSLIIPNN